MSRVCEICNRGPLKRASRSHSNIKTNRHQKVNLQWTKKDGKRVKACAKCIKTMSKNK
ncbi:MAG: bL28 family ribosomal protein [Parcubacteria group bacterium]